MPDDHSPSSRKYSCIAPLFRPYNFSATKVLRRTVLRDEVNYLVAQSLSSRSLRDGLHGTNIMSRI
ncbi:unnamed protein product, partial [Prunus brigantina]